jgi:formiminoglutamate deiminase
MQLKASLWFRSALLPQGWAESTRFTIEAGRVARIEPGVSPGPGDERHEIAVPGMPNVHSHAFQRAMAGLTEVAGPGEDSFWTWRELMYRFLERLGPEELEAISAFAFMEMLETGFTRVGEFHYLHHDPQGKPYGDSAELTHRIVAAAQSSGIGLTLLPVLYAHANFGGLAPSFGQRRFINDIDRFARLFEASRSAARPLADAIVGVAPHSLRAVTPEELRAVVALVPQGPIHIHAAEQIKEVEDCVAWSGRRPVEWLLEHVPIDLRWCLIHSTQLTDDETRRLAATGAVAGLCPVTEANLGDGIFPAQEYLRFGGAFGIGTDSNILIDPAAELRALEYSQRLVHRRRNVLAGGAMQSTGRRLFDGAIVGGNRSLGIKTSGLVEGAAADIVSLDADHSCLIARRADALLDGWIFAARDHAVDCVWRAGRQVVSGGRHKEREAIEFRYLNVMRQLLD